MEIILSLLSFGLLIWGIVIYNRLVRDKNRVLAAWSDIDVQLKRRHDLIPKLVDAVKQYANYEQATLSTIIELRKQSAHADNVAAKGELEGVLGGNIDHLLALAESYPELKANQSFLELQNELSDVENHIQFSRRYYNGAVKNLNIRIDSFPDLLIARLFRFFPREFFEMPVSHKNHSQEGAP